MGTNFTKELLTEIPNARDIWAAMSQAPGLQMTAYDVGGSHTGTQTGFLTYGFSGQNQTKLEGIDTTEGTGGNAGYFDFGSFEEFQVGGAGSDASNFSRRRVDEHQRQVRRRSLQRQLVQRLRERRHDQRQRARQPAPVQHAATTTAISSATRCSAATRSIASTTSTGNVGGPLWKQKAWFFYS